MAYADQLKSGRYSGVAVNPFTGRRFRVGAFASETEAVSAAEHAEAELWAKVDGTSAPVVERTIPTLGDYGSHILAGLPNIEDSTRRKYQDAFNGVLAHYGRGIRVDEVTPRSVIEFVAANQAAKLSHSWASLRLQVLRQVMNAAIVDGHRGSDPTYGVKSRRMGPARKHRDMLTDDQLHYLGYLLPRWFWVASLISHDCGLRISELCALKREHVDILHRSLLVGDVIDWDGTDRNYTKGKDITRLPMSARLTKALDEHLRTFGNYGGTPTGYLFCDPADGTPLCSDRLRRWFNRARVAIGAPDATWHVLRHGCAQALVDAGAPVVVPQVILRHKSAATTMQYVHTVRHDDAARWIATAFDERSSEQPTTPPLRVAR